MYPRPNTWKEKAKYFYNLRWSNQQQCNNLPYLNQYSCLMPRKHLHPNVELADPCKPSLCPCAQAPASLAPQVGKWTAHVHFHEIKSRNNHQVDPLAPALCTHFCNYILLLWKPRTFGSSSTQPLSHHPFWSQVWLLERKAELCISYSILCVTTPWQMPCFWRVPETRFLKFCQIGGRPEMLLYLN